MLTLPIVHAVFSAAAFGNLKQALGWKSSTVIDLADDLSVGPIDRTDYGSRATWIEEHLRVPLMLDERTDRFWAEVASSENRIVAWVDRRSTQEHAGLLALVSQREDRPLDIVDVTDIQFLGDDDKPETTFGIGGIAPPQTINLKLADRAVSLSPSVASAYRKTWTRLKQENALLRVIEGGDLVSVPITHFDSQIGSWVTPEWEKATTVMGKFHHNSVASGSDPPNFWFNLSRLVAMIEAGVLEGKGDLNGDDPSTIDTIWVRRL